MKFLYLYVKNYKMFSQLSVNFVEDNNDYDYTNYKLFKKMNLTALVGENGVGKTTLMSFIVKIFHHLQRSQSEIESDFTLVYEITPLKRDSVKQVTLSKEDNNIFIFIKDVIPKSLLLEWNYNKGYVVKKHQKNYPQHITYDEIISYLPFNIVTTVFSFHGEYPDRRLPHYHGHHIVESYNISTIYGNNHFGLSSISKGIHRFLKLYKWKSKQISELLKCFNMEFSGMVMLRDRFDGEWTENLTNLDWADDVWVDIQSINTLIKKSVDEIFEKKIYFNDLLFTKGEIKVSLSNMSSGEKMFFIRIFSILSSIERNSAVIIEEPELHLNPSWTKQIITMLEILFGIYDAHFIIATHSYSFINTLFPSNILICKENGQIYHPQFNTFLASEIEITKRIFINSNRQNIVEKIIEKKIAESDLKELEKIINFLGESSMKFLVFKKMKKLGFNFNVEDKE